MMEKPAKPVESLTTTPDAGSTNKEDVSLLGSYLDASVSNLFKAMHMMRMCKDHLMEIHRNLFTWSVRALNSDGTETSTTPTCEPTDTGGKKPKHNRWDRDAYNAYQREYMRKRRSKDG